MPSKIAEGRALFDAWAVAYRTQQRMSDTAQWARFDRAEQTAWDTLIDTVERDHTPETCACLACRAWRADAPASLIERP